MWQSYKNLDLCTLIIGTPSDRTEARFTTARVKFQNFRHGIHDLSSFIKMITLQSGNGHTVLPLFALVGTSITDGIIVK